MSAPNSLASKTLAELLAEQVAIADMAALAKSSGAALQAELERRFGEAHRAALKELNKSSGTITSVQVGGIRLRAETDAKVKWDQPKLWAFAETQSREDLESLCKIELTPREAQYKALLPSSNIKPMLDEARTDLPGTTKFKLLAEGEK